MQIERNIPIPSDKGRTGSKGRPAKYPWRDMQVGDSFLVPKDQLTSSGQALLSKLAGDAFGAGNFRTRKEDGGVRVWRLK